jgi:hypothetical protein
MATFNGTVDSFKEKYKDNSKINAGGLATPSGYKDTKFEILVGINHISDNQNPEPITLSNLSIANNRVYITITGTGANKYIEQLKTMYGSKDGYNLEHTVNTGNVNMLLQSKAKSSTNNAENYDEDEDLAKTVFGRSGLGFGIKQALGGFDVNTPSSARETSAIGENFESEKVNIIKEEISRIKNIMKYGK